jgi:hypothetical protein
MFKNLFHKSNKPKRKRADVIYQEYKLEIESKLASLGFKIEENKFNLGSVTKYKLNELEVTLNYDMRDPGVYLSARSGKMILAKTIMDERMAELEKLSGKKPKITYTDPNLENKLVDKSDISLALSGSDEEKIKLIQDLENWYLENS